MAYTSFLAISSSRISRTVSGMMTGHAHLAP